MMSQYTVNILCKLMDSITYHILEKYIISLTQPLFKNKKTYRVAHEMIRYFIY
jgi:hypothetical protein